MKKCFKCETEKPLSEFYKHKMMADGHLNKCKSCAKRDVRENREDKIDHYREYEKSRAMLPHRVEARKVYANTPEGRLAKQRATKAWQDRNKIARGAHILVGNAVRDGKIIKPDVCSRCGDGGIIHGHHDDYSKPLDVMWLCPSCHRSRHKELDMELA